jgi:hypothetical protein
MVKSREKARALQRELYMCICVPFLETYFWGGIECAPTLWLVGGCVGERLQTAMIAFGHYRRLTEASSFRARIKGLYLGFSAT